MASISKKGPVKRMLIKYNRMPHFIGAFPPFYDIKSQEFVLPKRSSKSKIMQAVLCINTLDIIYLWIKVAPKMRPGKVTAAELTDFYMHLISRTVGFTVSWQFYFYMDQCINLLNVVLNLVTYFEGT